jgi:glycosyltransferase involved in cell wall biosynthesis
MTVPQRRDNATPWVLVSAGFHESGGQSRANAALADYLLGRGSHVHLVGHDFAERFQRHSLCSIHAVRRPLGADFLGMLLLRRLGRRVARRVILRAPAARVVVNGGCCHWADVNWVHYVHAGWTASSASRPSRARLKDAIAGPILRSQERHALQAARLVVANSELTRDLLLRQFGLAPDVVHTVYLGSDPSWGPAAPQERTAARNWLGRKGERPIVAFVGGLGDDERKGFDTLWRAWQLLCADATWDSDLVVAGGGAALAWWQACVARAGLARRVQFLGFTDRVRDLLAAADLLVSPIRYEPYGLNVQEAICRGVPALVSGCAGVAERYPAELGGMILPDPNDAADLAVRLRRWRDDVAGWRERFRGFSDLLRQRSWTETARRLVALAEERDLRPPENQHEYRNILLAGRP